MYKTHRIEGHPELDMTTTEDALTWATNEVVRLAEENARLKERLKKYESGLRTRTKA